MDLGLELHRYLQNIKENLQECRTSFLRLFLRLTGSPELPGCLYCSL
jgi:hypothetical protein